MEDKIVYFKTPCNDECYFFDIMNLDLLRTGEHRQRGRVHLLSPPPPSPPPPRLAPPNAGEALLRLLAGVILKPGRGVLAHRVRDLTGVDLAR